MEIPDDPIIRSIERTGYPPWIDPDYADDESEEDDDDLRLDKQAFAMAC